MDTLLNYLLQFGDLNEQQKSLVISKVKPILITKGQYFSEAGKIPNEVAFVEHGILRVLYYNHEGDEVTRYFIDENNWAVDLHSFNLQIASSEYIQAITECRLLIFTRQALDELVNIVIPWEGIMAKVTSKALLDKVHRISPMMAEDAKTRYIEFVNRWPGLVNRIPLNYLASYIGITKSSLSRIRASLNEKL